MSEFTPVARSLFSFFEIDESYMPVQPEEDGRFQELRRVLILRIEELIARDTEKLMWVLYRIDVDERKVHAALMDNSSLHYADVLADLIIARQIEKAKTRAQFNDGPADWSFDV